MNRRGFLKGVLASGCAPFVMSGAVAGGVLMPARRIWVRPAMATLPNAGELKLFAGDGTLLATISVGPGLLIPPESHFCTGAGRYSHSVLTMGNDAVPVGISMSMPVVAVGDTIRMSPLALKND